MKLKTKVIALKKIKKWTIFKHLAKKNPNKFLKDQCVIILKSSLAFARLTFKTTQIDNKKNITNFFIENPKDKKAIKQIIVITYILSH